MLNLETYLNQLLTYQSTFFADNSKQEYVMYVYVNSSSYAITFNIKNIEIGICFNVYFLMNEMIFNEMKSKS